MDIKKLVLFLAIISLGAAPSRTQTYTPGEIISSSEVTENENNIYNYLQVGVDTYADGSIVNADISSSANIQSDKLNLTSIAQAMAVTSSGSFANSGTTTLNGDMTFGNGTGDDITINAPAGITYTPAATWTFTGNQTVSGTWADLGIVTTADINGGTVDGTNIGATTTGTGAFSTLKVGTTNQGDILYDNGTSLVRIVPGTAGQYFRTGGAAENPSWADASPGWNFIESSTFSSVSTVSITETISAGDVYKVIFEGVNTDVRTLTLTINADTTSGTYAWNATGVSGAGSTFVGGSESSQDDIVFLDETSPTQFLLGSYYIELIITARNSDTQVRFETMSISASGNDVIFSEGVGLYNAGTPTSIELIGGNGDLTGRNYVYKANTAL